MFTQYTATPPAIVVRDFQSRFTTIKHKLGRAARLAAAVAIGWLSLTGVASASTTQPAGGAAMSRQVGAVSLATNAPITGCVFQTSNGRYLTAVSGGGRITDVIRTNETQIRTWEKFALIDSGDGSPNIHYGIRTSGGFYLTAVGGGGRITDVMHSNATQLLSWEKFSLVSLGSGVYAIQTINGNFLTAVGGGGRTTDTIHSDATQIGTWEQFRVSCGH